MDKNAIKKYAVWARRELIERVSQRAMIYGITAKDAGDPNAESVNGHLLSQAEKRQRQALIRNIKTKGYEQVMEEVAYTWFNRFAALRFMEVNGYLPSHIRVFTNDAGEFKPQILAEAIHLELEGLDMNKVYELESANKSEELFKYLLIVQCNALNNILPGMFQRIEDYTELLLPDYLLREDSVLDHLIKDIPEDNFDVRSENGQVEIIGWLYQYYNTDLFNAIFDGDKSRKSLTANDIPAATQLFTPDWAVRYMAENSLGKYWIEGHPTSHLREDMKYYLAEADQPAEVLLKLDEIRKSSIKTNPVDIRVLDCCMGSGHILVYAFELLLKMYDEYGYSVREAVHNIVRFNLFGLDIDERAAQLAYFAIMMKARQYDRRFFTSKIQPNVYEIRESNHIDTACVDYFAGDDQHLKAQVQRLFQEFHDAKEYGSILKVSGVDFEALYERFRYLQNEINLYSNVIEQELYPLVRTAEIMSGKYDVVITNPPYLASPRMNEKLLSYIKTYYEEGKADFSTVMYLAAQRNYLADNGFISFITTNSWMFLKSFVKVRKESLRVLTFDSLVDYGTELFEGKIGHLPIIAWVARKSNLKLRMHAVRLVDYKYGRRDEKYTEFFQNRNHFFSSQEEFEAIDGSPVVYWISEQVLKSFDKESLDSLAEIVSGMTTGDNNKFLRLWTEVDINRIAFNKANVEDIDLNMTKWIPYHKGGEQRKWYGNHEYVVNWAEKDKFNRAKTTMTHVYLKPCITWSDISGNTFAGRYCYGGFMFDVKGSCAFGPTENLKTLIAIFNSKIMPIYVEALNPTTTTQVGDIKRVPLLRPSDDQLDVLFQAVDRCVEISKAEWDSYEFSWDFRSHPLIVPGATFIRDAFVQWQQISQDWINEVKHLEEVINGILIDVYGLTSEQTPDIDPADITLRTADQQREIKSLISYAVGCMFGRYSLSYPGLAYAGGQWVNDRYSNYQPDRDGIIPICDDEYFEDDVVSRFVRFIEIVYGKQSLEDNLRFIADSLGGKGASRDVIRDYFLNGFYADHLKIYQKRPIYWLFDSGKKNGFKCLMYIHRYMPDTIARIRTDYVHEQQSRYRTAMVDIFERISRADTSERVKLNKRLTTLQAQAEEIMGYEEKIHHLADQMIKLDLDDGVVENYRKLQSVLAAIK